MIERRYRWLALLTVAATMWIGQAGAETTSGGELAPAVLAKPGWYTPRFHELVVASGQNGTPLPQEAGSSAVAFPGIRPGSWVVSPNWCTLGFIFSSDGTLGGTLYAGTARHCVRRQTGVGEFDPSDTGIGASVSAVVSAKLGSPPRAIEIGTVVDISRGMLVGNDFALIKIKDSLRSLVTPSVAAVGGPSNIYSSRAMDATLSFGHGLGLGTGGTPRAGALVAHSPRVPSGFGGLVAASPGDSGSPVLSRQGLAIGVLTHIGANLDFPGATAFGTRIETIVSAGWLQNGTRIYLVSCPSTEPWTGLGCPA